MRLLDPQAHAKVRRRIIDAARGLFAEKGFHAASMNDVARACRLTKPALYHYFKSKHDLMVQLQEEMWSEVERGIQSLARPKDLEDALLQAGRHYLKNFEDPRMLQMTAICFQMRNMEKGVRERALNMAQPRMDAHVQRFFGAYFPAGTPKERISLVLLQFFGSLFHHAYVMRYACACDVEIDDDVYLGQLVRTYAGSHSPKPARTVRPLIRGAVRAVKEKARMKTLLLAFALAGSLGAAPLSLDQYLGQVRQHNPQLRGAKAQDLAYSLAAQESLTVFSPQAKAQLQRYSSRAEALVPMMAAKENESTAWSLGLGKLIGTGAYIGLDYQGDSSKMDFGAPPAGFGAFEGYGQQFTLNVSQPLWRNLMAREARAGIGQAMAGAEAAQAGNRYTAQALLLQARAAYVQLSTARQALLLQTESLERNQKLLAWTKRKYADNLADKVDVLQVEAALRQVQLALSQSREEEAKTVAKFNQLRGSQPEAAIEELEALAVPASLPAPKDGRQDLAALRAALKGGDFMVESVKQRYTPDLSVFASLGLNDRDAELGATFGNAFKGDHPTTVVGIKASANLDLGLIRSSLKGAAQAQGAGQAQVQAKQEEVAADWAQLQAQWQALGSRLGLAKELEGLQKEKAEREKRRYLDGRTSNFQVLRFEDDYALSRVQTLQLTAAALALEAQARFYNGDDQPW